MKFHLPALCPSHVISHATYLSPEAHYHSIYDYLAQLCVAVMYGHFL